MTNKIFTLSEANELLPQLKEDLLKLQTLTKEFEEQYLELKKKKAERERVSFRKEDDQDPFFEAESQLEFMRIEVNLLIENFTRKGVLLKMINPGLLDFPAVLEGKEVLICWKQGEERITHFHGWHEGFMGRKTHPEA
ncbi:MULTISPECIES: DUF2203 domain-containing protein [unclassified Paenibacillus]|uniref:DUF2203 domain-containing protein n=1 Tax=unclassified Paenibacillus TaxID=185978 RepID=UPI001AE711FF|nr:MULTISPECIES: DUF2203 domain-containing protein [unclassified Paenibacillus]MBP1155342.1 hypothetical protein [Paenibacillus sp. PvP091]MBP1169274.1 hypothetical protein [Paenibacillus sp. PvR098]MBP2440301.1 hypothetical protein [Paenibacillus sp. PvP052]